MTVTKGGGPRSGTHTHVPDAGTPTADAIEKARRDMLHEARITKRTRIGADVVCEALLRQGVDVLFGYPGGVILPLYDVLGDYPELRHVLVRHEQGAAHAADGYARATGSVGVCMGTSGPGATNLVTGIATAKLDSIPMVAITGNVAGALLGQGRLPGDRHHRHHPADDEAQLPRPRRRRAPARLRRGVPHRADRPSRARAHRHHEGRPPGRDAGRPTRTTRRSSPACPASARRWTATRGRSSGSPHEIAKAKRPVILAGHGVLIAEAWDELRELAEKAEIPVAWTLLGIGAMDETHPLAYGYMGMHGWKHVNRAIQSADLLIALGMRFDDRVTGNVRTYAPHARIVHVDIDPAEIGKNVAVDVPIVGDVRRVLTALLPLVAPVDHEGRAAYMEQLADWRRDSEASSWHGSGTGATASSRPTTSSSGSAP